MTSGQIREEGVCCITGKPLSTSEHTNYINLPYKAEWEFPRWENFITGEKDMACAIVHDDAIGPDGKLTGEIKYAIEIRNDEIFYHPVVNLKKEYPAGGPSVCDKMFFDSPAAGAKECICSRCGKMINEDEMPVRLWPGPGDIGYNPAAKGGTEYRYHISCYQFKPQQ